MKLRSVCFLPLRMTVVILPALIISACSESPELVVEEIIRPIKMITVASEENKATLEYPGVIAATQSVELGFEVQGKIIELPITESQQVSEGEVLARLDSKDYVAARDGARSNHYALNSVYKRAKKIFDLGAGSQAEVDLTLRDVRVAYEQLKTAQKALDDTTLVSPFSGEVAKKIVNNFQNVQAKEPILLLQDRSSLEIDVTVPEQDFVRAETTITPEARTERVQPEIILSAMPGKRFPARFKSFSSAADPVTRTYKVTLAFDNPEGVTVLPGMTAKVVVHVNGDKAEEAGMGGLVVPVSSIASDAKGNAYAWMISAETMQVSKVSVSLGTLSGANVRIIDGLKPGDKIAISGVHYLSEGMKVRPLDKN